MSQAETVPLATRPEAPMRPITYAPVAVEQTQGADGSIVLRSRMPLGPFEAEPREDVPRRGRNCSRARRLRRTRWTGLAQDHLCGGAAAGRRDARRH